jgi:hypothetical protein
MPHRSANTIVASIAATDNNHILALCINIASILKLRVQKRFRVELETIRNNG